MDVERYNQILEKQIKAWPNHVKGGKEGNPFATLCDHCYGRHSPPHGIICPNKPPFDDGRKS